jgi:hypothetical protein
MWLAGPIALLTASALQSIRAEIPEFHCKLVASIVWSRDTCPMVLVTVLFPTDNVSAIIVLGFLQANSNNWLLQSSETMAEMKGSEPPVASASKLHSVVCE